MPTVEVKSKAESHTSTPSIPSPAARFLMQARWCFRVLAVPALLLGTSLASSDARAQNVVFSGTVTAQGGQPLPGANVAIPDLGVGGVAAQDGKYSFTVDQARVRGRSLSLTARFIGHKPKRLPL